MATSSLARLSDWFETPAGRRLISEQSPIFEACVRRFHGDSLLWVGCHTDLTDTVRGCMVRERIFMRLPGCHPGSSSERLKQPSEPGPESGVHGASEADSELALFESNLQEIPLANQSLSGIVVHHGLEVAQDPRMAIRELSRALAPGGRILICGFNPWSLWGMRGLYARFFDDGFSGLKFVSPGRLMDWLTVLGFEVQEEVKYLAYGLPLPRGSSEARLWRSVRGTLTRHRLPIGGAYVITAVKQALAARPDWRLQQLQGRKLAPVAYPKLGTGFGKVSVVEKVARKVTGNVSENDGVEDSG